jgi:hypothetical protein
LARALIRNAVFIDRAQDTTRLSRLYRALPVASPLE